MANKKYTKRALFGSVIALILCCAMLIGTTFAWFTDTASSGVNTIQTGNLDIEVYYAYPSDVVDGDIPEGNWKKLTTEAPVFDNEALWEPGFTQVAFLKFANEGNLALEYQLKVDILKETNGVNKDGNPIQLSNYINAYACNSFTWDYKKYLFTERDSAINPNGAPNPYYDTLYNAANGEIATPDGDNPLSLDSWQWLEPAETTYATIVLWMPTTVGNEANHNGTDVPSIDLGINVLATQYNWENEKDSFDQNYDENAEYPGLMAPPLTSPEAVQNALTEGGNFVLGADVAFDEGLTVPAGVDVTLDLAGHSITANPANEDAALVVSGNVHLRNSGNVGTIKNVENGTGANKPAIAVALGGTLNFDSGDIVIDGNRGANGIEVGGYDSGTATLNFNGGKITVNGTGHKYGIATVYGAVVNMNGGEIEVNAQGAAYGIHSVMGDATVNLNSGKISVNSAGGYGVCAAMESNLTLNIANGFVFEVVEDAFEYGSREGNAITVKDNRE